MQIGCNIVWNERYVPNLNWTRSFHPKALLLNRLRVSIWEKLEHESNKCTLSRHKKNKIIMAGLMTDAWFCRNCSLVVWSNEIVLCYGSTSDYDKCLKRISNCLQLKKINRESQTLRFFCGCFKKYEVKRK